MSLVFNLNMSSKFTGSFSFLLQRSHLETMSVSNECDKIEKIRNYFINYNV